MEYKDPGRHIPILWGSLFGVPIKALLLFSLAAAADSVLGQEVVPAIRDGLGRSPTLS